MNLNPNKEYQLEIIRDKCISAATCVALAPNTFKLDENEIAKVINQEGDELEDRLMAAKSCPVGAIRIIESDTGKLVWPLVEEP